MAEVKLKRVFHRFFILVIINTLITCAILYPLFTETVRGLPLKEVPLQIIPYLSHSFILNLLVGLLGLVFLRSLLWPISIILFLLLQALLVVDVRLYTIFHYHLNSLVLNVITTEGVTDSVRLGKGTLVTFGLICLGIFTIQYITVRVERRIPLKGIVIPFLVFMLLAPLDKGLYAWADLNNYTPLTRVRSIYPLYIPLTIKRFAADVLKIKVNREEGLNLSPPGGQISYPKRPLEFSMGGQKYNIVIFVMDGLRYDMFDPQVMPNLWRFSQRSLVYRQHYSSGNGTRFGIFGLMYGVEGTYWHRFLENRLSPVLIDTLMSQGYQFRILSSTRLTFPEFRKTVFVRIPQYIRDTFDTEDSTERDRIITEDFIRFIRGRDRTRPFFSFVFYNSSHQPFQYPKEFERFTPVSEGEINYFRDVTKEKVHLLRNRYKNSIYYEDHLLGLALKALREEGLLRDTIVVITGDHGEEFYEQGYFGHTASFNEYQIRVPFVMYYPGQEHRVVTSLTSHLDLVPTLMQALGCTSPVEDYSQGYSLLQPPERRFVTSSGWSREAIITPEHVVVFSMQMYSIGPPEVRRKDNYQLVDASDVMRRYSPYMVKLLRDLRAFYE